MNTPEIIEAIKQRREALEAVKCKHENLIGSVLYEDEPLTCIDCDATVGRDGKERNGGQAVISVSTKQWLVAFLEVIDECTFREKMSFLWSFLFIFFLITIYPSSKTWLFPSIMKDSEVKQ